MRSYFLPEIIGLAIDNNPRPAGAIGAIDIQQGLVVRPALILILSVVGRGGEALRDGVSLCLGLSRAAATTVTEYNAQVSQPLEWPAKREARVPLKPAWKAPLSDR